MFQRFLLVFDRNQCFSLIFVIFLQSAILLLRVFAPSKAVVVAYGGGFILVLVPEGTPEGGDDPQIGGQYRGDIACKLPAL